MALNLVSPPLIDRPDFEPLLEAGRFGVWSREARALHDQGFCVLELDGSALGGLPEATLLALQPTLAPQVEAWRRGEGGTPRLQDGWQQYPEVLALACQPLILDCLRCLYGREPFPFQTLNFAVGSEQHFHSDAVHFHSYPHGFMCGVWVALEDVLPGSGPLLYYPGSHREPYQSAASLGLDPAQVAAEPHPQRFFEALWRDVVERRGYGQQQFLPKRGQALIWHANLLHGGTPVADRSLSRWSQVTHYYFADCLHTTPLLSFGHDHGGAALRNPFDLLRGGRRFSEAEWQALILT